MTVPEEEHLQELAERLSMCRTEGERGLTIVITGASRCVYNQCFMPGFSVFRFCKESPVSHGLDCLDCLPFNCRFH